MKQSQLFWAFATLIIAVLSIGFVGFMRPAPIYTAVPFGENHLAIVNTSTGDAVFCVYSRCLERPTTEPHPRNARREKMNKEHN